MNKRADTAPAEAASGGRRIDWWLVAIFVGCSVTAALLVFRVREWAVMTDELLYTEMARGMLSTGLPLPNVRGEYVQVYQVLYPLLIAPVIWIVGMPEAYQAIAVVNAVTITSACVPAYLLTGYVTGDRVLSRWVALCVGVLPWIALATKILTDSLAFPLFVWAVYAIIRAVAEGAEDRRRDWIALAAIAAAYLARSQFVVLPAVFCVAILAREFAASGLRAAMRAPMRRPWPFVVAVAVAALVVFKPAWIIGIYSAAAGSEFGSVVPGGLLGQMSTHLAMVSLGIGVVPLILALPWITAAVARADDARQNSAALTIAVCSVTLLFVATSFDMRFSRTEQVYERYIFYLAPLLLVGTAALIKHPPRRFLGFLIPAFAGLLIFARDDHYGLDSQLTVSLSHAFKPVVIFQIALQRVVDAAGFLPSVTVAMAITAMLLSGAVWWMLTRGQARDAAATAFIFIAAFSLWATAFIVPRAVDEQNRSIEAYFGLRTSDQKTWVDRIAQGRHASLIQGSINFADGRPTDISRDEKPTFWDVEFWNSSVRSFYTPIADKGANKAAMSPYHRLRVRFADGSIGLTGGESAPLWLMSGSDPRFAPLPSAPPVREHFSGLTVYPVPARPHADWATRGLSYRGFVPARGAAVLRVYGEGGNGGNDERAIDAAGGNRRLNGRLATVRVSLERKFKRESSSPLGVLGSQTEHAVIERMYTLCLPERGYADIDLKALASPLADRRRAVRLLQVKVERDGRGCRS